jgi:hypothetical protein
MEESVSRTVGQFDKAEAFIRVVPLDDGSHGWTRGRIEPWGARPRCKSKIGGQRLVVVVVKSTAAGRTKISVSIAHVGFLGWFE